MNGIKQMEKVYFFDKKLYIRINEKNVYLIEDELSNIDKLLIWDIKNQVVDKEKLMKKYNLNNDISDYHYLLNVVLASLEYKTYFKIN